MRRLALIFAALLWAIPAHAFMIGDPLSEFGTGSVAQGSFPPYNVQLNGNVSNGTVTLTAISSPLWNPNNVGAGSVYFRTTSSGITAGNTGLGIYFQPGNPISGWLLGFWFRNETNNGGGFFLRFNDSDGGIYGGDEIALEMDGANHITIDSATGFTSASTIDQNWHFMEVCIQPSASPSTGSVAVNVDNVNYITQTNINVVAGSTPNRGAFPSFNFDNELLSGTPAVFDFGPWYIKDIGTSACPATSPFSGKMYSAAFLPTANKAPNNFTPSTGTNFSNVNSAPAGANYNSSATVGNQDCYNFSQFNTATTGIVFAEVGTSTEKDAGGARLTLPLFNNGSGTIGGGNIVNLGTLTNGTYGYMFDGLVNSPFTSSAWTGAELANACVQVNN